jgi:hypothetical protein
MTLHILTAATVLATILHFRPPLASAPLYRPRTFRAYTRGADIDWSPAADYATPTDTDIVRELDGVEARLHADLEWLEATVAVWLDRDPIIEHAHHVLSHENISAVLVERVLS